MVGSVLSRSTGRLGSSLPEMAIERPILQAGLPVEPLGDPYQDQKAERPKLKWPREHDGKSIALNRRTLSDNAGPAHGGPPLGYTFPVTSIY